MPETKPDKAKPPGTVISPSAAFANPALANISKAQRDIEDSAQDAIEARTRRNPEKQLAACNKLEVDMVKLEYILDAERLFSHIPDKQELFTAAGESLRYGEQLPECKGVRQIMEKPTKGML